MKDNKYYRNPKWKNEFGIFVYQTKHFSVLKFFVFPEYTPGGYVGSSARKHEAYATHPLPKTQAKGQGPGL
jgi:hypothetical protein